MVEFVAKCCSRAKNIVVGEEIEVLRGVEAKRRVPMKGTNKEKVGNLGEEKRVLLGGRTKKLERERERDCCH